MESREATQFLQTVKQIKVYSYLSSSVIIFIIIYYFCFHRKNWKYLHRKRSQGVWRGSRRRDQTRPDQIRPDQIRPNQTRRNVIFKQHPGQHQVDHQYVSGITSSWGLEVSIGRQDPGVRPQVLWIWEGNEDLWCIVRRNLFVGSALNCRYRHQQCTRWNYTRTRDCLHKYSKSAGYQPRWSPVSFCNIHRHFVNFGWRKLFPKTCVLFTNEVTFGISARVIRHTCMIWISENRRVLRVIKCDSSKITAFRNHTWPFYQVFLICCPKRPSFSTI